MKNLTGLLCVLAAMAAPSFAAAHVGAMAADTAYHSQMHFLEIVAVLLTIGKGVYLWCRRRKD
jgi:uncharacterized membrane protein YczE